jgi:hypothetical protein
MRYQTAETPGRRKKPPRLCGDDADEPEEAHGKKGMARCIPQISKGADFSAPLKELALSPIEYWW